MLAWTGVGGSGNIPPVRERESCQSSVHFSRPVASQVQVHVQVVEVVELFAATRYVTPTTRMPTRTAIGWRWGMGLGMVTGIRLAALFYN